MSTAARRGSSTHEPQPATSGRIFGVPRSSESVLIVDPEANTANTSTITGLTGAEKWIGGVLAPNGRIYCIPRDATQGLIIDHRANGSFPANLIESGYLNKF